ncbi:uncharacterized protein METZ01_LOCUS124967, partial [marine metagenome]
SWSSSGKLSCLESSQVMKKRRTNVITIKNWNF